MKKHTKKQLAKMDRKDLIELVMVGEGALDVMEETAEQLEKMDAFAKEQVTNASKNLVNFNNANTEVARLRLTIVEMVKADYLPRVQELE